CDQLVERDVLLRLEHAQGGDLDIHLSTFVSFVSSWSSLPVSSSGPSVSSPAATRPSGTPPASSSSLGGGGENSTSTTALRTSESGTERTTGPDRAGSTSLISSPTSSPMRATTVSPASSTFALRPWAR